MGPHIPIRLLTHDTLSVRTMLGFYQFWMSTMPHQRYWYSPFLVINIDLPVWILVSVDAFEISPLVAVMVFRYSTSVSEVWRQVLPRVKNTRFSVQTKPKFKSNTPWLWFCEVLTDEGLESRGVKVDKFPVLHPLIEELRKTWFKFNPIFFLIAPYLRQPRASCWAVLDLALIAVGRGVGRKSWVGTSSSWRSGRQSNKPKRLLRP